MSKARFLGKKYFYVEEGTAKPVLTIQQDQEYADERLVVLRVDANARDRKGMLRNKNQFIKNMIADGVIAPHGCDCSHCRNGWDCCGRMFVSYTKVKPAKGGVNVIQHWTRNI